MILRTKSFAIRYDNWFRWYCFQISTPYISIYKDEECLSINVGILIGELQFWFGNVKDLLD